MTDKALIHTGSQFLVYQTEDGKLKIDVRFEGETVWLSQQQMAELFQTTKQNIGMHIRNVFSEGELREDSVVKESLTTEMPTDKECCNAAKVVATTAGWLVVQLREQVKALEANAKEYQWRLNNQSETITLQTSEIALLQSRIKTLVGKAELPFSTDDARPRYIVAENYMLASSEEATQAALYVRREAGDSACDLYLPVNPVTTFQEEV